jgi:hypothetical protein
MPVGTTSPDLQRKDKQAMGLFSKMRDLAGSVPSELLEQGLLGRGIIVSVQQTTVSSGVTFDPSHVCVFTVEVALDGVPRYTATCRQAVPATVLPQLVAGEAIVAVRVDPDDHSRIALSLGEQAPVVTMAGSGDPNTASAARILEYGEPCRAVIVHSQPLGMRNPRGDDMYAFVLTVLSDDRAPYQVQVGNPVPAAALALLHPGNTVPAKRITGGDDRQLVIDWHTALTQTTTAAPTTHHTQGVTQWS